VFTILKLLLYFWSNAANSKLLSEKNAVIHSEVSLDYVENHVQYV